MNAIHSFDLSLFYAIFGLSGRNTGLDWLIVLTAEYLLYPLLLVVAYLAYREWRAGRLHRVYDYCVAVVGALFARFGVAEIIRLFYHRPRPYVALHLPHLLSDTSYSFPSGHTIFLFALATGVYGTNRKLAYWLYASGVLIGAARVAAGVHYPSDILGGAILGVCTGYAVYKLWKSVGRRIRFPFT